MDENQTGITDHDNQNQDQANQGRNQLLRDPGPDMYLSRDIRQPTRLRGSDLRSDTCNNIWPKQASHVINHISTPLPPGTREHTNQRQRQPQLTVTNLSSTQGHHQLSSEHHSHDSYRNGINICSHSSNQNLPGQSRNPMSIVLNVTCK